MAEDSKNISSLKDNEHPVYISLLKTCAGVSHLLISNPDFEEALKKITKIIADTRLFDRVFICELTKSGEVHGIERYYFAELGKDLVNTGSSGWKEHFLPELLEKIYPELSKGEAVSVSNKERSAAFVPVITGDSCWGFIALECSAEKNVLDEKSLTVFRNIASGLVLFFTSHSQRLDLIIAKEMALESEAYANSLFEQSPLGMAYLSVNGNLEKVNKAFESLFGFKSSAIAGKFNLLTDPVAKKLKWDQLFLNSIKGDPSLVRGIKFNPADFGIKGPSLLFNISPFQIRIKGKVKKIALVFKDISDIVRNESFLTIQRNLAYAVMNSRTLKEFLSVVHFELSRIIDFTGIYIAQLYNKSDYFAITGYMDKSYISWTEPLKGSLEGYVFERDQSLFLDRDNIYNMCINDEISYPGNIPAAWIGVPFSGDKSSSGLIAITNLENRDALSESDVSIIELVANEAKIFIDKKRSEEHTVKITKAITESPSSIIITDRMGVIEYVNPKFTNLTGYTPEEVIGHKPSIMKSGDTPDHVYKNLWTTITSGQEWRGELKNRKKSGEFYWEDVSISPVFDDNGYISHYVAVKEDITDIKQLISELITARDRAEESDRLKTSFLQNISHEIRTPMNGIMGFIDLLRDNELQESEKTEYLNTIEKCGNRMLLIINDLIDISKIEAGVVQVNRIPFMPINVLRDLVNFFTPEAEREGLTIGLDADNILRLVIASDQDKLYAALSNLIKNAIKFTHQGSITIKTLLKDEKVTFVVSDTGIGIPAKHQEKIFERFVRVENSNMKSYEGTGLGLSIVKGYAELLGGTVEVISTEGKGSEFRFTIPARSASGKDDATDNKNYTDLNNSENEEMEMTKVLIAEDEETNRLYLKTLLKKRSYELITASNGKEAVDLFELNRDIKLVLMDIRMPVMDGYQATREIRKMDRDVIIIAQTAYASAADKDKVMAAGCNGYILKPIRKEELFEVIDNFLPEN